jgi:hypothetical protein
MRYGSAANSSGGDDVALAKSFIINEATAQSSDLYNHIQSAAGLISRQSSFKYSKFSMKQQLNLQIYTTASRKIGSHCGVL